MLNPNIRKLDLSGKINGVIPKEIFDLKNLRKLNISNCGLKELPQELSKIKYLELLDASNNRISNIYAKIFELEHLKVLILNNNNLVSLPKQISKLKNLQILSIANNRLVSLPDSFSALDRIEELNFTKNNFTDFPFPLIDLKSLKRLWIGDNKFVSFPIEKINNFPKIQAVYCYSSIINSKANIDESYLKLSKVRGNCIFLIKSLKTVTQISNKMKNSKSNKIKIFISYSHEDSNWLTLVKKHLKVLSLENIDFDVWDDTKIKSGSKWKEEIEQSLNECKIAILLISTDFLASDFIINDELPPLLKSAETKGTKILPLIVAPSRFVKNKYLNVFQAVNNPTQPLSDLTKSEQDNVLLKLVDDIEYFIDN